MEIIHTITLTQEELKEALLDYINKNDGKFSWKNINDLSGYDGHGKHTPIVHTQFEAETV
jgi:hypothetical protein